MEAMEKNVINFGDDMISSVHVDNKRKDILIIDEGQIEGLNDTILAAKAKCPTNSTQLRKRFMYSLNIIEATVSYLLMLQKYTNSK